jgi:hypothetical protein
MGLTTQGYTLDRGKNRYEGTGAQAALVPSRSVPLLYLLHLINTGISPLSPSGGALQREDTDSRHAAAVHPEAGGVVC